uniref:DM14 domain-containing protein n=1 Tax=Ditylenchus dipsaci TaxID=166011 RepID=A0A915CQA7_9BILA
MDFSSAEDAVYGQLDDDTELLEELYRLESESAKSQHVGDKRKAQDQNLPFNIPSNLLKIEYDDHNDDLLSNDDTDDEGLLAELAGIVDDGEIDAVLQSTTISDLAPPPVPKRKSPPGAPPAIPERRSVQSVVPLTDSLAAPVEKVLPTVPDDKSQVDTQLLTSLKDCKAYYQNELKKAVDAQNSSTQRRIERTLTKIAALQLKVQKGGTVNAGDIPPYQPINLDDQVTSAAAVAPIKHVAPADPVIDVEKPVVDEQQVEPKLSVPDVSSDISKQAESILFRRRDQYMANVKAAAGCSDKEAATTYMETVHQFNAALAALREGAQLTLEDIAEIPPSPPPYRAAKFQEMAVQNKNAGEDAKCRMNTRMMTKIKEAIKDHKKGVLLDLAALPTPIAEPANDTNEEEGVKPKPRRAPLISQESLDVINSIPTDPTAAKDKLVLKTEQQDQLKLILSRQLQLKKAAMEANKKGDIPSAKDYLRQAKSLDQMVEAAKSGLPVKLQDIPQAPADKQRVGSVSQKVGETGRSATLEKELLKQVQICQQSIAQFQSLGDAKTTLIYEALLTSTQSDLHTLQTSIMGATSTPKFKLVEVTLPVLELNPDIPDANLDLKITKIEKMKLPDGWTPPDCRTAIVKGTDCPEFTDIFRLNINRKSRQLLRVLKRTPLKLEVFQKENGASIVRTVELLEGRRKTGGTINVEVKIHKPIGEGHGTGAIKKKWVKLV